MAAMDRQGREKARHFRARHVGKLRDGNDRKTRDSHAKDKGSLSWKGRRTFLGSRSDEQHEAAECRCHHHHEPHRVHVDERQSTGGGEESAIGGG